MHKSNEARRWCILIAGGLGISLLIAGLLTSPAVQSKVLPLARFLVTTDLRLRDTVLDTLSPLSGNEDLVFLGIDESTLTVGEDDPEVIAESRALTLMAKPFPWTREVWALTIDRVLEAGARVVILDLLLNSPRNGDEPLRQVLEKYPGRVVLASNLVPPANSQGITGLGRYLPPSDTLIPTIEAEERTPIGFVNFRPDIDGLIRRVTFLETVEATAGLPDHPSSPVYPSLAKATLTALGESHPFLDQRGSFITQQVDDLTVVYSPRPLYEIFWPSLWRQNYENGDFFRDKVVMIGPSAVQLQDQHPTPAGTVLGPQLHLNAISAIRGGKLFRTTPPRLDTVFIIAFGILAMIGVGLLRRPMAAISALVIMALAFLLFARSFLISGQSIGLLGPLSALGLAGGFGIIFDYSRVFRERLMLRRALERRVSSEVLSEILDNPHSYLNQLGGVRKTVTILFSDLRGFTKMSENSEPEEMVARLNTYFDLMVGRIQDGRGMVDKFIGDAIMAVWGSVPSSPPGDSAQQAVRAALEMQHELEKLNQAQPDSANENEPPAQWAMGIGLHCGEAITGNIGSEKRLELTVIGDAVNLASRLEGVTKRYGVPIIVSDTIAAHLAEENGWVIRPIDRVQVVGRKAPVTLHQPLAAPDSEAKSTPLAEANWRAAFETYLKGEFEKAAECYEALAVSFPDDIPSRMLRDRCLKFTQSPPPDDWDGSIVLESK